jgi:hypothetical protein
MVISHRLFFSGGSRESRWPPSQEQAQAQFFPAIFCGNPVSFRYVSLPTLQ